MIFAVVLAPDGNQAVSAIHDKILRVWGVASGELLWTLKGHTEQVTAVALTPEGSGAVSGSSDETSLRVWDVATGNLVTVYPLEARGLALGTAAGNRIAAGTSSGQLHFLTLRMFQHRRPRDEM